MSKEQLDLLDCLAAPPSCSSEAMPTHEDAPAEVDVTSVRLIRTDPACDMHRFYSLEFATSLFGERGVVRHWGRIRTSGRSRTDWFNEPQEAEAAFLVLLKGKRRRGYTS